MTPSYPDSLALVGLVSPEALRQDRWRCRRLYSHCSELGTNPFAPENGLTVTYAHPCFHDMEQRKMMYVGPRT